MKALLIVGSPKGKAGTSYAIGRALFSRLAAAGAKPDEIMISTALASPENIERLGQAVDAADLVVFSFPLYVDQLPAPLLRALEFIAGRKSSVISASSANRLPVQRVAMIVQCGFPETHQNRPAVDIMRIFAREAGFHWAGGLAMGMGGAANRPLDQAKGIQRNIVKALDAAAAALAAGEDIPAEAIDLMGKPLMAEWLYTFGANFSMKRQIRKHGVKKRAYDRPYA